MTECLRQTLLKGLKRDYSIPLTIFLLKKEIIVLLEGKGIEYNPRQTKSELIKLLGGD